VSNIVTARVGLRYLGFATIARNVCWFRHGSLTTLYSLLSMVSVAGFDRSRMRRLLSRLLSSAGFVVVGLLFLLPFFRVTFLIGEDPFTIAFDGTDLLTGGGPTVVRPAGQEAASSLLTAWSFGRQPLAIAALAVLVASLFTFLIRDRLMRHACALGLAVLIGALLVGAYLRATYGLDERLFKLASDVHGHVGPHIASPWIGFFLMIGTLNLLVIGHAMALARAWDRQ
jgi:hypothetical protein